VIANDYLRLDPQEWNRAVEKRRAALGFPQHSDEHCPQRPILLAVDQRLAEGARLRITPELADPLDPFEVGQRESWRSSARAAGERALRPALSPASISSKVTARP
jgi:hypothetical protein